MIKAVLLFILGLLLLIKGGDWFVEGATAIAKKFHIPEILIGATVVSIGTTLPEVMVSASAAALGQGDMAYGNAIGSIICNVSLIAALTIAIKPGTVEKKTLKKPVIFFFIAAIIYSIAAYVMGFFYRWTGLLLLGVFVVYISVLVISAKKEMGNHTDEASEEETKEETKEKPFIYNIGLLVIGAVLITIGARLLVNNGTFIASELGVPETVIALTFVALGTSLPELVTAITSLVKGHGALSLGNIIGANILNLVLVSGVSIVINPFKVPTEKLLSGMNASLVLDIPLMFTVMLLLTLPPLFKGKLYRWQGILLLLIYAGYTVFQFAG